MNALTVAGSFAQQLDDSTVAVLALMVGIVGGYQVTGWRSKLMKAKRAKIAARPQAFNRKPD